MTRGIDTANSGACAVRRASPGVRAKRERSASAFRSVWRSVRGSATGEQAGDVWVRVAGFDGEPLESGAARAARILFDSISKAFVVLLTPQKYLREELVGEFAEQRERPLLFVPKVPELPDPCAERNTLQSMPKRAISSSMVRMFCSACRGAKVLDVGTPVPQH
ncbi:hypothetical protein B0H17DRAFT_1125137 [Mycena rosella]|uniref:TIR domain-containing protein n=1 Tax=Mycena rosella TaxID=1033263 RepID=A0AAD7M9S0_MYCRO|nr:hypothetical protein B0H17DRAFT_1125137 [Mycena rosella]